MYDLHLFVVPLLEEHTEEAIFGTPAKMLDAICPVWRIIMIGVATDGDRSMTGCVRGVSTHMRKVVLPGFVRV